MVGFLSPLDQRLSDKNKHRGPVRAARAATPDRVRREPGSLGYQLRVATVFGMNHLPMVDNFHVETDV